MCNERRNEHIKHEISLIMCDVKADVIAVHRDPSIDRALYEMDFK